MMNFLEFAFALLVLWLFLWPLAAALVAKLEPWTYRRHGLAPPKHAPVLADTGWRGWALKGAQYALLIAVYAQIRDGFGPSSGQAAFWAALMIVYGIVFWLGWLKDTLPRLRRLIARAPLRVGRGDVRLAEARRESLIAGPGGQGRR